MKLTKKLEAEILKVYKTYWEAYLKGDMKTFASYLADDITVFGTAVSEIFNNKKETLRFYKATADQLVGKAQFRSRSIKMRAVDENILLNEQCDFYVLIEKKWMFYGHCRISSILKQTNSGWKLAHQHASFPDTRADEGEQVAIKKIKEENLQLRDAVKRRTIELEEKNRELEIEASVERVRAKALAMHSSEEIREVVRTLRNELFGLKLTGVTAVTICLKQDDGRVRFWDITDLETTGRYSADITFDMAQTDPRFYLQKIWSSKKKIIAFEQDSNDLKRTLKWLGQYDKRTADEITELIKVNKIKRGWHRAVKLANGRLITDFINEPPTEIESILLKMGAAFDLAYKRFLDLKNAEEQTKEARIELALERVRARAMAMHNSNELAELVSTVFKELTQLDFKLTSCIIWIHDHENTKNTLWIASTEMNKPAEPFLVKVFHNDFFKSISHAWKSKDTKWVYTFTGKEKKNFEKAFFKEIPQLPIPLKNALKVPEQVVFSASFNNFGALEIVETEALTEEKFEILHRFGKVFDSSYTRFNDLKKAEAQARDAQIESGLERVRSKTMAMHKSEEVTGIAVSLNEELLKLGFEGGSTIIIIDKESGDTEQWTGFSEDKTLQSCDVPYFKHPCHDAQLNAWKSGEKFLVYTLTGKEKKTFDEHYFATGYKHFPESDKKWMRQMGSVTFSYAFMKYGAIHWGPGHLTEEQLKILQRFAKVFEQSYTRFLDLQKAEVQVKEAQIEAALERVRSRSMAMHKSDDLHEVIKVVTEQLFVLSLKFNVANFAKINQDGSWDLWLSTPEQAYPALIHVPYLDHPIFNRITEEEAKGNNFYTDVYTWEETNIFFHHFFENTIARNTPEERKQFVYSSKGLARSVFQTKNIWFSVARYDITAFTDEENAIFKRFANVFEQAYTRFLDLQKAEAQARETEIELSLERVRAKTMAMQKPSEFVDIINIIGSQFIHLRFDIDWVNFGASGFAISEGIDIWNFAVIPGASPISARVFIPYFDHPVFTTSAATINEFTNGGKDFVTVTLDKQTKDKWLDHLFTKTIFKDVPEEYRVIQYAKPGYTTSNISLKDTWLSIGKFDIKNFTDEQHAIFRRFANAFGQAYTRFLDLQKAEAQAREAQIEASLERVRSRAMAMQNSDELRELIGTVFTELTKLDIVLTRCLIMIYDPGSNDSVWWMANSEAPTEPIGLRIQNHEHPPYIAYLKAWQQKKLNWVYVLEGAIKKDWDDFLFVETELSHLPDFVIAGMKAPERVYLNSSFNSFGNLTLATLEPLSNEHFDILLRFAKVFDLTYTRFNDLKQAEAQAKESRIQLALERVRARTMAMQKSDELAEAARLLYEEFNTLGINTFLCGYCFYKEEQNKQTVWVSAPDGTLIPDFTDFPLGGDHVLNKRYEDWKQKKPLHVLEIKGEENKEHHRFLSTVVPKKIAQEIFAQIPDRIIFYCANFSAGYLFIIATEFLTREEEEVIIRFAKVFDLTYTRFNDLQKAEAQTIEAQIELALERVRARTMAMHKSEELAETAQVLFQQLNELGGIPDRISIGIADEINRVVNFWTTDQQGTHLDHSFSARLNERTTIAKIYQAWKEQKKSLVVDLHGDELKEWIQFAREEMGIAVKDDQIKNRRVHTLAFFSHGWILVSSHEPQSPDTIQILERFASVFNLTYRRFLDLQKAETQANEARIEIALERIRARALAMHKSDELMEVAKVMREQMALLGQPELEASVVHLYEEDPDHILSWRAFRPTDSHDKIAYGHMSLPKNSCEFVREWLTKFYSDEKEYTIELSGAKQDEWYDLFFKFAPDVINSMRQDNSIHDKRYYRFSKFSGGALLMISKQEPSEEATYLQKRAAVVFDLAFRRFSDLQKAEAQAREAQIEGALEKVRSHTMGMRSSEDLANVASVMFDQMRILGGDLFSFGIVLCDKHENMVEQWHSIPGAGMLAPFLVPVNLDHIHQYRYDQWKAGIELFSIVIPEDYIAHHFELMLELPSVKAEWEGIAAQGISLPPIPTWEIDYGASFRYGYLLVSALKPFEEDKIFSRFAKVFEQAYTRFLDLQKAEASAREAQIEASLERVRSKTMAMHNSQDVGETVATMFDELVKLGIEALRCGIGVMHEGYRMEVWTAKQGANKKAELVIGQMDMRMHALTKGVYSGWRNKEQSFSYELKDDDLIEYFTALNSSSEYPMRYEISSLPSTQFHNSFYFPEGVLYVFSLEQLRVEFSQICKRFAGIFGQTYRRFLDLQKAEANAREAQIEAGLERVRARTMAMHNSEDVGAATATMFTELEKLGIQNLRGGITIIKAGDKQEVWGVTNLPDGRTIRSIGEFDMHLHALWRELLRAKLNKEDYNYYRLAGKDKEDYINILNATPNYLSQPIKDFPDVHVQSYFFGEGAIWTNSLEPHSEEQKQTMKRFASVFSLTFRRYQDLKKAEAQAREATIEAALERVRGKAMAMHSSKDLTTTIGVFYHELEGLNLTPRRCGVGIINKETMMAEISTMNASADGEGIELVGNLDLRSHPVLTGVYTNWLTKTEYHPVLRGNEIKEYYQIVRPQISFPDYPNDTVQYGYFYFFEEGGVYTWTEKQLSEEELKIYRRFTSVLSLTYKRYKDLKDSEARTQAAIKDAALDRIRADIASMRTINDLDRITPLIWNELTILGIPFIRCGVFIMDDEEQLIHTFLSTPDGKAIAAFHLPYDTPGNISKVIDGWRNKTIYLDHWGEEEFVQFADILMKQGSLSSREQYLKTIPPGGFHLHFLPFLQGMLYVGNTTQLDQEEIELIQHVADAFSTAYARYEDFNKLEAAKQTVEKTLTDLKQAQTQLVQSEKMASLGELTAGIAHEIQNPLNFVNNFSEVSKELLDEMKTELETGNTEDAKDIADDVIQNLEKINHHGKRADAIVKSMLQHSRSSSGKKEPADINGLADEYLRLAYHGLRAKDKSFNAKFETEFDSSIGKINIISQDIGRVLVNLINNAFYAVSERRQQEANGYEPTVTVYTKKIDDKIEIKVKDNGNGIPQKVLDKIFQPFFTTKPTGQGTGLGLSLAYDIITKGHGGELKVETKEGEGSEFIIQLPVSKPTES